MLNNFQSEFYFFVKLFGVFNIYNFDFWLVDVISQLKICVVFGQMGGLLQFGRIFELLILQLIGGQLGGQVGIRGVDLNLVFEIVQEIEFGIDFGLFNDNVVLEVIYYNKGVNDLILDQVFVEFIGILVIVINVVDLENCGIELVVNINFVCGQNFDWFICLMYWLNELEIICLDILVFI